MVNSRLLNDYEWDTGRIKLVHEKYLKETRGYILSGRISIVSESQNLEDLIIWLAKADSMVQFRYTSPSSKGDFQFLVDSTFDNQLLIIQDFKNDIHDIHWTIENKWEHSSVETEILPYVLNENQKQYLDYLHQLFLVRHIYDNSFRKPFTHENNFTNHNFFIPSYAVRPEEFEELTNFEEIASNLLPAVRFYAKKGEYYLNIYIKDHEKVFEEGVGLFLNGVPFSNLQYLASLSSLDITKIEVTNKQIMHGELTFNGIVSVYTKKQNIQPSFIRNSFFFFDNKANPATVSRDELYALPGNSPVDNCLFWDPDVEVFGGDTVSIEWNTLNLESDYWMVINGVSGSGTPIHKIVDLKVE
jgi:hypothetical protein